MVNNYIQKNNLYESKNEINSIIEDMGRNLPIDHAVSLPVWGTTVGASLVPTNMHPDAFVGSLYCICRCTFCGFNHPPYFTIDRK